MQARSDAYQHASSRVSHFARTRVRQDWHSPQRADHRSRESPTSSRDTILTADDLHTGHRRNRSAPDGLKSATHRRCARARAARLEAPALRRRSESHIDCVSQPSTSRFMHGRASLRSLVVPAILFLSPH
jgi:hypothetical protein